MYIDENTIGIVHIPTIINRTGCTKHNKNEGYPCWSIETKTEEHKPAVCNSRAKKAGFVGTIKPESLRTTSRKKP